MAGDLPHVGPVDDQLLFSSGGLVNSQPALTAWGSERLFREAGRICRHCIPPIKTSAPRSAVVALPGSGVAELALMLSKSYALAKLLKTISALVNGVELSIPANPPVKVGSGAPV